MKKVLFILVVLVMSVVSFASNNVFAAEDTSKESEYYWESKVKDYDAVVEFEDPDLAKQSLSETSDNNDGVTTMGLYHEEYSHSDYEVLRRSLVDPNAKPLEDQIFMFNLVPGQTETFEFKEANEGQVSIGVSVSLPLKKVINAEFTGNYTGTWSSETGHTRTFTLPADSEWDRVDFYQATAYDEYATYVEKTDYYDVYNGEINTGQTVKYTSEITVDRVYVPKQVIDREEIKY